MAEPILFKKYANRRLYNTSNSKYVTLRDMLDIVCEGHDIKVIDAKTKEDVTGFILTQIILEQAKSKNILMPVPFLHLIIRNGENMMPHYFENQFQQMLRSFESFIPK